MSRGSPRGQGVRFSYALSTLVPAMMAKGLDGAIVAGPLLALLAVIHIGDALLTRAKAMTGLHSQDGALPTGEKGDSPL